MNTTDMVIVTIISLMIIVKNAWLLYFIFFRAEELPEDLTGSVSEWGTFDDNTSMRHDRE
jgi:hypothetical protein